MVIKINSLVLMWCVCAGESKGERVKLKYHAGVECATERKRAAFFNLQPFVAEIFSCLQNAIIIPERSFKSGENLFLSFIEKCDYSAINSFFSLSFSQYDKMFTRKTVFLPISFLLSVCMALSSF
jgi:hypothetical protein